jgi:hypothetical protein
MNLELLQGASWYYRKRIAQLIKNENVLVTIKFGGRISEVYFDNRVLQIKKWGFCLSTMTIEENGNVLFSQRRVGFWGYKHDVLIGNRAYRCISKLRWHYHVDYTDSFGNEIISYHQSSWKWNPPIQFNMNRSAAPLNDLLLLIISGYVTLRKLKQDSDAAVVATTLVVSG